VEEIFIECFVMKKRDRSAINKVGCCENTVSPILGGKMGLKH